MPMYMLLVRPSNQRLIELRREAANFDAAVKEGEKLVKQTSIKNPLWKNAGLTVAEIDERKNANVKQSSK